MQLAKKNLRPHARKYNRLTDGYVEALHDFAEGEVMIAWDKDVRGLQVRVGKHRVTWSFLKEHRIHGRRGVTFKRLGFFPRHGCEKGATSGAHRSGSGRQRSYYPWP